MGGSAPLALAPKRAEKDLPPEQAARVCLATAQEMEKGGAEAQAAALYEKARKDDPGQQLDAGTIRFDPDTGVQLFTDGGAADGIGIVDVAALLGADLQVFGVLAGVRRGVGHFMDGFAEAGVRAAFRPRRFAGLEGVAVRLDVEPRD